MRDVMNKGGDAVPEVPPGEALDQFMSRGWADAKRQPRPPAPATARHAERRRRVSRLFPGEWLVVPAGRAPSRANDIDHPFRPQSDYAWLAGHIEAGAVLVMAPEGDTHQSTLFLRQRTDRSTPEFFRDGAEGELWVGKRATLEEVSEEFDVATAPLSELSRTLEAAAGRSVRTVAGIDRGLDALLADLRSSGLGLDEELQREIAILRLVKDNDELRSVRLAVDATVRGFEDMVRELRAVDSISERWLEGTFRRRARCEGNDIAYGVIVAGGANACTLHWTDNDGTVRPGDLVLIDAGVESPQLYAADVTRTLPVSGRFDRVQREVYHVVWSAQQAALAECRPGNSFTAPHRAATAVLRDWLAAKGFLPDPQEVPEGATAEFHRRFTLHGTSHMLGLDVHDCAAARETYLGGVLDAGMVLTVEPGCYFQPDDLTVPSEYRGIGVRIEDDVAITADGYDVLSAALPTHATDVEAWMEQIWATS